MNKFKKSLVYGSVIFSSFGGFYLQLLVAHLIKLICICRGFKNVGFRNSSYFKTSVLGLSDIDITYIATGEMDARNFVSWHKKFKKIFPLWCESNIYLAKDLELIKKIINTFEAERDPLLNVANRKGTDAQKVVFFFRMLKADMKNLKTIPFARIAKWQFHFRQLGLKRVDHIGAELLVDYFLETLKKDELVGKVIKEYIHFQQDSCDSVAASELSRSRESWRTLMLIDLPFFIGGNVDEKSVRLNSPLNLAHINEFELEVIREQICWELIGIYSQKFYLANEEQVEAFQQHLNKIKTLMNFLGLENNDLRQALTELF